MWGGGTGFSFTHVRQTVQLHGALHSHVPAQVGKLHLDQLAWVQRAMPVPVRGNLVSWQALTDRACQ